MKAAVAVFVLAIAAAFAWLAWTPEAVTDRAASVEAGKQASTSSSASSMKPGAVSTLSPAAPRAPLKKSVFEDLVTVREYRALYDRLNGTPEGETPKGRLVMYELLRECANVNGGLPWPLARRRIPDNREQFVAGLAAKDPRRERRIAAYEQFTAERCAGLGSITISGEELERLLHAAAAAGEPAAKALEVEHDLWNARRGLGNTISDSQVQTLQEAAATRDPEAIRIAGRVLSNSWKDYGLRVGPEELPIEARPFVNAWLVLSCEYGAPCGADTPRMQQLCALQGHCDAQTFPEYLANYATSPHDATMLLQYRTLIRNAIESGDWSQFRVLRGQPQGVDRQQFVPGPR